MRTCDECGIKMPMFTPRTRADDGRLLCDGCHPDRKGAPGRPIGLHGSKDTVDIEERLGGRRTARETYEALYGDQEATEAMLACEACHTPMGNDGLVMEAGLLVCPNGCPHTAERQRVTCGRCGGRGRITGAGGSHRCTVCQGEKTVPAKAAATTVSEPQRKVTQPKTLEPVVDKNRALERYMQQVHELRQKGLISKLLVLTPVSYEGRRLASKGAPIHVLAHDSGDGATVYHCPFCGSGQVTGGADGTVECDFCKSFFTVQVQPERAAMPQTVNGQPQQMPGMPGDGTQPAPFGGVGTDAPPFEPPMQEAMDTALQGVPAFAPPTPAGGQPVTSSKTAAVAKWVSTGSLPWEGYYEGHQDHEVNDVYVSSGTKVQCETCKEVIAWFGEDSDTPSPYIPASISYSPTREAKRRFFLTEDGLLPEEGYVRHLAIKHADDRESVIDQVRSERG